MTDLHDDLIELQTRLAFQEDTINQLNQVITNQDAAILQLQQQMRLLARRLDELALEQQMGGGDQVDERPPHY
jgi:SlyX protein